MTKFVQLNDGWNADPNWPDPQTRIAGADLLLSFGMNYFQFENFDESDVGVLRFSGIARYRLGSTNDEGWYRGQCRFSGIAPAWGEFYELTGDLRLAKCPRDWIEVGAAAGMLRHYLFYFRDETFECDAVGWSFAVEKLRP